MTFGQGRHSTLFDRLGGLVLVVLLALAAGPGAAQEPAGASSAPQVDETGALVPSSGGRAPSGPGIAPTDQGGEVSGLNYDGWADLAGRADAMLTKDQPASADLDAMRALLVDWREALSVAQSANSTRIAVIRSQIAALGPAPEGGTTEVEDIARRRSELTDQLVRLQAPGLKADEAYEQANGLILELDRLRRDRQAEEMLRLWPSPLNPANWPAAWAGLSKTALTLWKETNAKLVDPAAQSVFINNLPLLVLLSVFSGAILWRGSSWLDIILRKLPLPADARAARVSMFLASLGQIIIPVLACFALTIAVQRTGMVGPLGLALSTVITTGGIVIFTSKWLGGQLFSIHSPLRDLTTLSPDRWAEGRFLIFIWGLLLAIARARTVIISELDLDESVASVTLFPVLLIGGLILVRMGLLLSRSAAQRAEDEDEGAKLRNITRLVARAATVIGVVGPILAAIGYNSAAMAMIRPATFTLGLLGFLALIQALLFDMWAVITRQKSSENNALTPVLLGFVLGLASLPIFALIWGADVADLTELWSRFQGGFSLGETRISPADFLLFAFIFAIGYSATRLLQSVLRGQVLPRVGMDQGGRNAITVGTGYVGIFLSALFAINTTGIDLSGLAIVAGALSVGIGFGLQNIVSNFVSGIILLIERPVSEGDWIEVGSVQGTVKSISVRSTRIQTFDRTDVIVPNTDLIAGQVTNWTRFNLSGRLIVPIGVAFGSDTRRVAQVLREIAEAQPLAVLNPPPVAAFMGFGADAMNFEIRVILRDINFLVSVRSEINHQIVQRFHEAGIEIPFAQSEITLRNAGEISQILQLAAQAGRPVAMPAETPQQRPAPLVHGMPDQNRDNDLTNERDESGAEETGPAETGPAETGPPKTGPAGQIPKGGD
jgi:potassium efflux system protein